MTDVPLAVRSRRRVAETLESLRDRFGSFPHRVETFRDDPARFERGVQRFEAGFHGSARVRITVDDGRVLLVRERGRADVWGLPGGGNEPDESLRETAEREAWEEAGVEVRLDGVWAAATKRYVDREVPERRGYLLDVVFTAEHVGGEAGRYPERWDTFEQHPDEVILAVEWVDTPPETAAGVVSAPDAWDVRGT